MVIPYATIIDYVFFLIFRADLVELCKP